LILLAVALGALAYPGGSAGDETGIIAARFLM
jgi:hypothetical protein